MSTLNDSKSSYILWIFVAIVAVIIYSEMWEGKTAAAMIRSQSPVIGKWNASSIIHRRLEAVQREYEAALSTAGWRSLRIGKNVTIEKKDSEGWPYFIRTVAELPAPPDVIFDAFRWHNFEATQQSIDPFYESSRSLFETFRGVRVIQKATKRPLFYPKRLFTLGLIEHKQQKDAHILPINSVSGAPIAILPRGTLMSSMVNLDAFIDDDAIYGRGTGREQHYIKAYQDFCAWFIPHENGSS